MKVFAVHLVLAGLLQLIVPLIGRYSYSFGYLNIEEMTQKSLGFNLLLRAMSTSVFIVLFSVLLYLQNSSSIYIENIWLVSVYYLAINLIVIHLTRGFIAESKLSLLLYFLAHGLSVYISYLLYQYYIVKGLSHLLPSVDDFRTELWLIIILFLYKVFNEISFSPPSDDAFQRTSLARYRRIFERYSKHIDPEILNNRVLRLLFLSIAIYEDMNRNWLHRKLENTFFPLLKNKTTGIMQTHSERPLTDEESIKEAEKIILKNYKDVIGKREDQSLPPISRDILKRLLRGYNTRGYSDQVIGIFNALFEGLSLPDDKEEQITWLIARASYYLDSYRHEQARRDLFAALRLDPTNEEAFGFCVDFIGLYGRAGEDDVERLLLLSQLLQSKRKELPVEAQAIIDSRLKEIDAKIEELDAPASQKPTI